MMNTQPLSQASVFFIAAIFSFPTAITSAYAISEDTTGVQNPAQTTVQEQEVKQPSRSDQILERILHADTLCRGFDEFRTKVSVKSGVIRQAGKRLKQTLYTASRPVVLCAFRESDKSWHTVEVGIFASVHRGELEFDYRPVSHEYTASRVGGRGVTRLTLDLIDARGEHLTVYRYLHLWFSAPFQTGDTNASLLKKAERVTYTPPADGLYDQELVLLGERFLFNRLSSAYGYMRERKEMSRAFPGQLLVDVIPIEVPMALTAIEQIDDGEFSGKDICVEALSSGGDMLPDAECVRRSQKTAVEKAYLHFALNKDNAFRWSVSIEHALGAFQFTDRRRGGEKGTYSAMVSECKQLELIHRFEDGARDLSNSIKAAVCLLDYELARLPESKELYKVDPLLGLLGAVAAYNGGNGWARKLLQSIKEHHIDLYAENVRFPVLYKNSSGHPHSSGLIHHANGKKESRIALFFRDNSETPGYVTKYRYLTSQYLVKKWDQIILSVIPP